MRGALSNPPSNMGDTAENYQACVILSYRPTGPRWPACSTSFVTSPGSRYNIALTAAHCVSDTKGNFILDTAARGGIDKESIICCAYDASKGTGACPRAYSYKTRSIRVFDSYHKAGFLSKDPAVLSVYNSPTDWAHPRKVGSGQLGPRFM
jgi:hypothetical protein